VQPVPLESTKEVLQSIALVILQEHADKLSGTMSADQIEGNDPGVMDPLHTISLHNFILDSMMMFDSNACIAILNHHLVTRSVMENSTVDDSNELTNMLCLYLSHMKSIIPDDNNLVSLKSFVQKYFGLDELAQWSQLMNMKSFGVLISLKITCIIMVKTMLNKRSFSVGSSIGIYQKSQELLVIYLMVIIR
jgi:hypothetical protein